MKATAAAPWSSQIGTLSARRVRLLTGPQPWFRDPAFVLALAFAAYGVSRGFPMSELGGLRAERAVAASAEVAAWRQAHASAADVAERLRRVSAHDFELLLVYERDAQRRFRIVRQCTA